MIRIDADVDDALAEVSVPTFFRRLRGGMEAVLRDARTIVQDKPPVRRMGVAKYWTPKQRRWFFAALREGQIDVPYQRGRSAGSFKVTSKWTSRVTANGKQGELENNVPYAKYLYSPSMQSKYHAGNWKNTDEMANEIEPRATDILRRAVAGR